MTSASAFGLTAHVLGDFAEEASIRALRVIHVNHQSLSTRFFNELLRDQGLWLRYVAIDYRHGAIQMQADLEREILKAVDEATDGSSGGQIVLLEDGGHATFACSRHRPGVATLGVEQTMKGRRRSLLLEHAGRLPHPVISIARSQVKVELEAPALAVRMCDELSSFLTMAGGCLIGANVRMIGYGVIGRAMAWRCRAAYACRVEVVERLSLSRTLALTEGFECTDSDEWRWRGPTVVIGATGTDVWRDGVPLEQLPHEIYLCSVSSGQIEFRSLLAYLNEASVATFQGSFGTEYTTPDGRKFVAIADGRPVNFFRSDGVSLPAMFGDLIFALMIHSMRIGLRKSALLERRVYEIADDTFLSCIEYWKECHSVSIDFAWPPISPHAVACSEQLNTRQLGA